MVPITRGLLDALLEQARSAEPDSVTVALSTTPAGELEPPVDLPPETPVLSHLYLPDAGRSVSAVFGMDLGTPAGSTQGRFVSHPAGDLRISRRDDLHGVVLVAVPPWDADSVAAFTRDGTRQELATIEAAPPVESL